MFFLPAFVFCFRRTTTVLCTLFLLTVMVMSVKSNLSSSISNNTYTCAQSDSILPDDHAVCEVTILSASDVLEPIYFKSQLYTTQQPHTVRCKACTINHLRSNGLRAASIALNNFDFSSCHIKYIDVNAIEDFNSSRIQTILLANNNIEQLNVSRLFAATPHLTTLNLSHNWIFEIHPEAFNGIYNLKTLLLNGNRIKHLKLETFQHLQKLHCLQLDHNYIHRIESDLFLHNVQLKRLQLNNNAIKFISANATMACINLEYFDLSTNPINSAIEFSVNSKKSILRKSNMKSLKLLKTVVNLNASNNDLSMIDLSVAHNLNTLDLSINNLSEINLKNHQNLKIINLSNNQFVTIDFGTVNMVELYVSGNDLNSIELNSKKLIILDASDNSISSILFNVATYHLKEINLSKNELVDFTFEWMQPQLHRLDLSFNSISNVIMKNCSNLRELYLANNALTNISELKILQNLTHLDVSYNDLDDAIDIEIFAAMTKLKYLNLSNNQLRMLSFMNQLQLEHLDVSNNRLNMIDVNSFVHLKYLQLLYIGGNHLKEIQSLDEFKQLPNLQFIDLTNNLWTCSEYFAISKYFQLHSFVAVGLEPKENYYCSNEKMQSDKNLNILQNFTAVINALIEFNVDDDDIDAVERNKSIIKLINENSKLTEYITNLYLQLNKSNLSECEDLKSNSHILYNRMYLIVVTIFLINHRFFYGF